MSSPSANRRIVRNRAQCGNCYDVIESSTRHDFVECGCRAIFVDGGLDYLRRGGMALGKLIEMSEYEEETMKPTTIKPMTFMAVFTKEEVVVEGATLEDFVREVHTVYDEVSYDGITLRHLFINGVEIHDVGEVLKYEEKIDDTSL